MHKKLAELKGTIGDGVGGINFTSIHKDLEQVEKSQKHMRVRFDKLSRQMNQKIDMIMNVLANGVAERTVIEEEILSKANVPFQRRISEVHTQQDFVKQLVNDWRLSAGVIAEEDENENTDDDEVDLIKVIDHSADSNNVDLVAVNHNESIPSTERVDACSLLENSDSEIENDVLEQKSNIRSRSSSSFSKSPSFCSPFQSFGKDNKVVPVETNEFCEIEGPVEKRVSFENEVTTQSNFFKDSPFPIECEDDNCQSRMRLPFQVFGPSLENINSVGRMMRKRVVSTDALESYITFVVHSVLCFCFLMFRTTQQLQNFLEKELVNLI